MGLFQRTFIYLKRNKRYCLLFVFIVVCLSVSLMLGINAINSINNTADKYKSNLAISFSVIKDPISYSDSSQLYTDSNDDGIPEYIGPMLCLKDAENIIQLDKRIQNYNAERQTNLHTSLKLKPGCFSYYVDNLDYIKSVEEGMTDEDYIETVKMSDINKSCAYFTSVVESDLNRFFSIGAFELIKGRHINKNDKYVVLISEYIAENNGLDIGDSFIPEQLDEFNSPFGDSFSVEVIGIFKVNFYQEPSEWTAEYEYAENSIYTDFESYKKWLHDWRQRTQSYLNLRDDEFNVDEIRFYVSDPDDIDSIVSKVEQSDVLDWQFYHIEKNDDYDSAVKPLNNISNMILLFVLLISGGCITVLFLLINMSEKARKKETYIYRSLGIYRKSITVQRVVEMVFLSVIAFIIAIIIGYFLIVPFGEYLSEYANDKASDAEEFEISYDSNDNLIVEKNIKLELNIKEQIGFEEIMITFAITEGVVLLAVLITRKCDKDTLILE